MQKHDPAAPSPSVRTRLAAALQGAWQALCCDDAALAAAAEAGELPAPALGVPKQASHGDFSTPFALALGRRVGHDPRQLAERLRRGLGDAGGLLARAEVAGPGHLNFFVAPAAWRDAFWRLLQTPAQALRSNAGAGRRVLLEFVSANPTGPLHVAHGRGAVYGDVVARLLDAAGYEVTREYYVNDLGHQTDVLARSVYAHYLACAGEPLQVPEEYYPGDYVQSLAEMLHARHGNRYVGAPTADWLEDFRTQCTEAMLERIRRDLRAFNVPFDTWVSERALAQPEVLRRTVDELRARGHVYDDDDGRVWFRSTTFGDDKDRVMVREDGRPTYFLSDVAYHRQKAERGYDRLINVWGADHGGYLPRIHASLAALGFEPKRLHVSFVQMVSLSRGGQAVKMGKRLGTAVWLREIVDEAGPDATRYMFATRKLDTQMDFDVDLARRQSLDNPVFYAQMGHARLCAIARRAAEQQRALPPPSQWRREALDALTLEDELSLMRAAARAPDVVADAAAELEPHRVPAYLQELISGFHSYYSRNKAGARVLGDDSQLTLARLLLCRGLQQLFAALLESVGVAAPKRMQLPDAGGVDDATDATLADASAEPGPTP